jgi:hypothetical protein
MKQKKILITVLWVFMAFTQLKAQMRGQVDRSEYEEPGDKDSSPWLSGFITAALIIGAISVMYKNNSDPSK